MKNDIFTISQDAKLKKNGNFSKIIDIEDTKLVEIMVKLPLIYYKIILLYFSTKAKKQTNKQQTNKKQNINIHSGMQLKANKFPPDIIMFFKFSQWTDQWHWLFKPLLVILKCSFRLIRTFFSHWLYASNGPKSVIHSILFYSICSINLPEIGQKIIFYWLGL